jgi:hypothetical protein
MSDVAAPDLFISITSPRAAKWLRRSASVVTIALLAVIAFWVYTRFQRSIDFAYTAPTWAGIVVAIVLLALVLTLLASLLGLLFGMLALAYSAPGWPLWKRVVVMLITVLSIPAGALAVWWFAYRPRVSSPRVTHLP